MLIPARRNEKKTMHWGSPHRTSYSPSSFYTYLPPPLCLCLSLSVCFVSAEFRFCNRPELLPIVLCHSLQSCRRYGDLSAIFAVAWLMNIANWRQIIPVGTPTRPQQPPPPSLSKEHFGLFEKYFKIVLCFYFRFLFGVYVCFRREFLCLYPARG